MIIPIVTETTKTTGCPEYTVEIKDGVSKCMTQVQYNEYIASPSYKTQKNAEIGAVVIVIVLFVGFIIYLFNRY